MPSHTPAHRKMTPADRGAAANLKADPGVNPGAFASLTQEQRADVVVGLAKALQEGRARRSRKQTKQAKARPAETKEQAARRRNKDPQAMKEQGRTEANADAMTLFKELFAGRAGN